MDARAARLQDQVQRGQLVRIPVQGDCQSGRRMRAMETATAGGTAALIRRPAGWPSMLLPLALRASSTQQAHPVDPDLGRARVDDAHKEAGRAFLVGAPAPSRRSDLQAFTLCPIGVPPRLPGAAWARRRVTGLPWREGAQSPTVSLCADRRCPRAAGFQFAGYLGRRLQHVERATLRMEGGLLPFAGPLRGSSQHPQRGET